MRSLSQPLHSRKTAGELTHAPHDNAKGECTEASDAERQPAGIIPSFEIVVAEVVLAEDVMFAEHDDEVTSTPVP